MYAFYDCETTGLMDFSKPAEAEGQPRIASIALIMANSDLEIEREYSVLIKPDGWIMEAGAMAVNGLTMERLEAEGIPILDALATYTTAIDEGRIFVCHNSQFDLKLGRAELRRASLDDRFERTPNICTMRGMQPHMNLAPSDAMMASGRKTNKPPKLIEAYRYFFNKDFEDAHSALADARACYEIFREMKKRGWAPEPAVHHAKKGSKSFEALKARGA